MTKLVALALGLILLTVTCSGSGCEGFYGQSAYLDPGWGYHIDGHTRQIKAVYANEWFLKGNEQNCYRQLH